MVFTGEIRNKLLNTIEKNSLIRSNRDSKLVIHPFDAFTEEFVRTVLVNQFDIHKIIIGHDHRFGRNRTATLTTLLILEKIWI
jgi:riboflavin kinase/FMN adenylyltransferase